jgi:TonB-dependent SusC/RagA subfamily outer membrane receptor
MKIRYILGLLLVLTSQLQFAQKSFDKRWSTVEQLEQEGRLSSALEKAEFILKKADKKENASQFIKAFLYVSKYKLLLKEDSHYEVYQDFLTEIEKQPAPTKQILYSFLAENLNEFYRANRRAIDRRTPVQNPSNDYRLWDAKHFKYQIDFYYNKSLTKKELLLATNLNALEPALHYGINYSRFRSTLLDLLANRYLNYLKQQSPTKTKIDIDFIESNNLYALPEKFSQLQLPKDTANSSFIKRLEVYQHLTRQHQKNQNRSSLLVTTLERLSFIKDQDHRRDRITLYKNAILILKNQMKSDKELAWIHYYLARFYLDEAEKNSHPDYLNKSLTHLKKVKEIAPDSYPAVESSHLEYVILDKKYRVTINNKPLAHKKFRALVHYKNIDSLYVHIYKSKLHHSKYPRTKQDSVIKANYARAKKLSLQSFSLPKKTDHYTYSTEILLEALPAGDYLAIFTKKENLNFESEEFLYHNFKVTDLSLTSFNLNPNQQVYIASRTSGKPIKNAKIHAKNRPNEYYKTNQKGLATIPAPDINKTERLPITITKDGDTLHTDLIFYKQNFDEDSRNDFLLKGSLFTDRSIYRPGQEVHFKAILTVQGKKLRKTVANQNITIYMRNANHQIIDSLQITTNSYGSGHGKFKLPENGLTGSYKLLLKEELASDSTYAGADWRGTYCYFNVEEYKRPRFEVLFDSIKTTHVINDSILLGGKAKAYFGGSLTQAKVTYTIDREIFNSYRYSLPYHESKKNRLYKGATATDANGNFKIEFKALAPNHIKSDLKPIYTYTINAVVTDVNGETQSASQQIRLGYHAADAYFDLPNNYSNVVNLDKNAAILVKATDLNGLPTKVDGHLYLYQYKTPNRNLLKRDIPLPEIQQIPYNQFIKNFPHTAYDSLDLAEKWPKTEILKIPIKINQTESINLAAYQEQLKSGQYLLAYKGQDIREFPVEVNRRITLVNPNRPNLNLDQKTINFDYDLDQEKKQIRLDFKTSFKNLHLLTNLTFGDGKLQQEVMHLNQNKKSIILSIPKNAKYLHLAYFYNYLGRYGNKRHKIELLPPTKNKSKLKFEVLHFRDKLEPGQAEQWQLKVLNQDGSPAEAEVLASMYDASLDQFKPHRWSNVLQHNYFKPEKNGLPHSVNHLGHYNQVYISRVNQHLNSHGYNFFSPNYARFNYFGYHFIYTGLTNKTYLKGLAVNKYQAKNTPQGYIAGKITDRLGTVLPGVQIFNQTKRQATLSNFDGYFILKGEPSDLLFVRYIGHSKAQIIAKKYNNLTLENGFVHNNDKFLSHYSAVEYSFEEVSSSILSDNYPRFKDLLQNKALGLKLVGGGYGQLGAATRVRIRGNGSVLDNVPLYVIDGKIIDASKFKDIPADQIIDMQMLSGASAKALYGAQAVNGVVLITTNQEPKDQLQQIEARTNLNETAFFLPQLKTNKKGEIIFNFKSPEALTKWHFQAFAHDKQLNQDKLNLYVNTQKKLNLIPNFPRFFRSKDSLSISAKISNLSNEAIEGIIQLSFTNKDQSPVDLFTNSQQIKNFSLNAKNNTEVTWKIAIPEGLSAVKYRIVAKADNLGDGEEGLIPVFTNRVLATETLPIWVNPNEQKEYSFNSLKNNNSPTKENHQLVFEYTSNPAWTSLLALPYLVEYPHECSEQIFAKFYASHLTKLMQELNPEIKKVLLQWQKDKTTIPDWHKNTDLKQMLWEESPWLKTAGTPAEQQKRIAEVLDIERTQQNIHQALKKLSNLQLDNGGFPWFGGGRANRFISLHIYAGLGKLQKLDSAIAQMPEVKKITEQLASYLDFEFLQPNDSEKMYSFTPSAIQYAYAKSCYDLKATADFKRYIETMFEAYEDNWTSLTIQSQLNLAILAQRHKNTDLAKQILTALRESAVINSKHGMYWKELKKNYGWHNEPITTQVRAIEAFAEIAGDKKTITKLKTWLIRQRKNQAWHSTKATTEAIYALLIYGEQATLQKESPNIKIGEEKISFDNSSAAGYVKKIWQGNSITKELANIAIKNNSKTAQYGTMYWQYFEESDAVQASNQENLKIKKELYKKVETTEGSVLRPILVDQLRVGDLIRVRLIIKAKEDFNFMHLKDSRAAGLEPVGVISKYKWQDGLGYYQSTKDVATHFFFDKIPAGTYVFEYSLRVVNAGNFSTGLSELQSMYAPEIKVQSKGKRLELLPRTKN